MGMTYNMIRVVPDVVDALRDRPAAVLAFIYREPYVAPKPGFFGRLLGSNGASSADVLPARRDDDEIDLDKSWHIIHYLLGGEIGRAPLPLGLIGDDLHPLADVELGSGKPNVVSVDVVKAFSDAVAAMSADDFLARFDTMPTTEIYLGEVVEQDAGEMKDYARENFDRLRAFVADAAREGDALITYFS